MKSFEENYGDWAVVTGASSGIGMEYARQLAAKGLDVVLVARREDRLRNLAEELENDHAIRAKVVAADLSSPRGIETLVRETIDLEIGLLVNNAGREDSGHFLDIPLERALATLRLNCEAPLQLTHHFGQKMRARGRGGILFMSSVVAVQGVALIANYAATKAYDLILAESVAAELGPHGVDVAVVAPGFTASELSPNASFDGLPMKPMPATSVARAGIETLRRSRLAVPGLINKFLYASGKYVQPRALNTWAFGRVFERVLRSKSKAEATGQPGQAQALEPSAR